MTERTCALSLHALRRTHRHRQTDRQTDRETERERERLVIEWNVATERN